ncbi:CDT1-like protein a, chloroplastic [Rutidosis leptorrhynchoides]|uniref:CDT1-like protein a, chloroplastic n=1 Tax=Rutidosis leptorrhynchoides TaxID=125765 RepID=UPI003A998610
MNSTGASSSPFKSFKSKKPHSTNDTLAAANHSPWSSKTPEKPTQPPRRPVTRRQSLRSVNQIREATKQLQKSDLKPEVSPDPLISEDPVTETLTAKPIAPKLLPEKYEMLDKFFNSLQCSIRLLRLKGSMLTFTNISRKVESLADRRFSYGHLAQIKFILPEAIELKKMLVRDDVTSCMKPELYVSLNLVVVQNDKTVDSGSANIRLSKLFRARLLEFCKSNPEGCDVPEEMLPEPFNRSAQPKSSIVVEKPNIVSVPNVSHVSFTQQAAVASHLPQSFKRRFSKQVSKNEIETFDQESNALTKLDSVPNPNLVSTPIKIKDMSSVDQTPAKLISTPYSATPAQAAQPFVRGFMTPDDVSMMSPSKPSSPSKLTRRSSGRKSLTFDTPLKNKSPVTRASKYDDDDDDDDDLCDILSDDLFASIKEKEQKALEEKDPSISQAKWRKKMIAGLPRLFDILLFFFQSIKRSVVTKQELVHTIISSHLDIIDKREVDEQLRLLQEFAPEWIYEKMASSGDLLFCVNKICSPESIRARLSGAN